MLGNLFYRDDFFVMISNSLVILSNAADVVLFHSVGPAAAAAAARSFFLSLARALAYFNLIASCVFQSSISCLLATSICLWIRMVSGDHISGDPKSLNISSMFAFTASITDPAAGLALDSAAPGDLALLLGAAPGVFAAAALGTVAFGRGVLVVNL